MKKLLLVVFIAITSLSAQQRAGAYFGFEYKMTSHTNPYVYNSATELTPGEIQKFDDKSSGVYIPFGYTLFDDDTYWDINSFALHYLISAVLNIADSDKDYIYQTGDTFAGDSFSGGLIPILDNYGENLAQTPLGNQSGVEIRFTEMDLIKGVFSTKTPFDIIELPFFVGGQAGIGAFGILLGQKLDGTHTEDAFDNDGYGLTTFNNTINATYGLNVGYRYNFSRSSFIYLTAQYDWHTFLDGVGFEGAGSNKAITQGNRLTVEATYFPFNTRSSFSDVFFRAYYKYNSVDYMARPEEINAINYSNYTIGFGVSYIVL